MIRRLSQLALAALLAWAAPAPAGEALRVLYGPGIAANVAENTLVSVRDELVQVELAPNLVLSAGKGAAFQIGRDGPGASASLRLRIRSGPAMAIDLERNRLLDLPAGEYEIRAGIAGCRQPPCGWHIAQPEADDILSTQRARLADSVLVRQQGYLDNLRFDILDVNRFLTPLLRGLAPRGGN